MVAEIMSIGNIVICRPAGGLKCHRSFIIIMMMLKNIFSVMSARLMLAAIDWNNSSREQC